MLSKTMTWQYNQVRRHQSVSSCSSCRICVSQANYTANIGFVVPAKRQNFQSYHLPLLHHRHVVHFSFARASPSLQVPFSLRHTSPTPSTSPCTHPVPPTYLAHSRSCLDLLTPGALRFERHHGAVDALDVRPAFRPCVCHDVH